MLTRSKIKLEESARLTQPSYPYFNAPQTLTHARSQTNLRTLQDLTTEPTRGHPITRNEILKELRQEYEILKSLPVEDTPPPYGKTQLHQDKSRLQESSISSSMRSHKPSVMRESTAQSPKVSLKELEAVHLEKKQLELVIGNSMRKIDQLLGNEIVLKKTIHELKNQLEGKGGVHQEYQRSIKIMQKAQEELQQELNKALRENEKTNQRIKDQADKHRQFEIEIANKDRQIKQAFQEQRRLHEQVRAEKDKSMNLEVQCRGLKVELDLLEKEKNSEVTRLLRQFEAKEGGNEKDMAYLIKKLEDEVKEKDHRYHLLLREKEQLRRQLDSQQPVQRRDKSYLSQLMEKSREATDSNNRALADSMNLIITKMAQLEKRNDETLKKELQALRKKSDESKRVFTDTEFTAKITELEKALQKEEGERIKLIKEVTRLEQLKDEQDHRYSVLGSKYKELQELEHELRDEIQELSSFKEQLNSAYTRYATLQEEITTYTQNVASLQRQLDEQRQYANSLIVSAKEKDKKYEDEIRALKRKVDEAEFEVEKVRRETELNFSLLRADHEAEAKKVVNDNTKLSQKLREAEQEGAALKTALQNQLKIKQNQLATLKNAIQALKTKGQEDLLAQRQFFENKIIACENRHASEIKIINQKFISVTSANQRLLAQLSSLASKDAQLAEMRRLLKHSTTMSSGVSHLWEIKEAEYGNINQVLTMLRRI